MTQTKKKKKQDGSLLIYFVHQQAFVPSMVITPPPVQIQQTHVSISQPPMSRGDSQLASHMILAPTDNLAHPSASCALVKRLLEQLHVSMEAIPQTLPHAGEEHPLAIFSGNPASSIGIDMDDWEDTLNPMVHHAFGYGAMMEGKQVSRSLAQQGKYGLDGFYQFMDYFVIHHGLQGGLLEKKVNMLLAAINFECMMYSAG